jgi:hypothetical protein
MGKFNKYFGNVGDAKVTGQSRYYVPGKYLIETVSVEIHENHKRDVFMPWTATVIEFEGAEYTKVNGERVDTAGEYKAGDTVTYNPKISHPEMGLANAKRVGIAFRMALTGEDEGAATLAVDEDFMGAIVDPDQQSVIVGQRFHVEAFHKTTKAGNDFTVVNFRPAE